jgi:glucosamine--fructose-6-phosphate aminotransferase (isomerizing)
MHGAHTGARPIDRPIHPLPCNNLEPVMNKSGVLMETELREAPDVVARQSELLVQPLRELTALLRRTPPHVVVTCARGSSAHAANFGKYLIERHLGVPVAAVAPSIMTVYRRGLRLKHQLFLTISQSGQSDDLVEAASSARRFGALTAAIVNDTDSPLASTCDIVLPMAAGPELSVAATKTFVASVAILLNLTANWTSERTIKVALDRLPDRLAEAAQLDWSKPIGALSATKNLATLGRGPTLAIAQEASLKLKEVCNIQAEAFSGAEFQHGPIALVSKRYPVLIFMPTDEAAPNLAEVAADISRKSATVFVTGIRPGAAGELPVLPPDHPETDAVCLIQSFYGLAVRLAEQRGVNVDQPRHLQKITRTR